MLVWERPDGDCPAGNTVPYLSSLGFPVPSLGFPVPPEGKAGNMVVSLKLLSAVFRCCCQLCAAPCTCIGWVFIAFSLPVAKVFMEIQSPGAEHPYCSPLLFPSSPMNSMVRENRIQKAEAVLISHALELCESSEPTSRLWLESQLLSSCGAQELNTTTSQRPS